MTRQEIIDYCLKLNDTYEDYPFGPEWTVMRHTATKKSFVFMREVHGTLRLNLKCEPALAVFLREQYKDVLAGYHMNDKQQWNTVIANGDVPDEDLLKFINISYELTKPKCKKIKENNYVF